MVEPGLYTAVYSLAKKYIPEGKHTLLHVDSREYWTDLMLELMESGVVKKKLSILTKCAINWEMLLTQKISIQN